MDKIAKAFNGKKANIGHIVVGYPSVAHTKEFLANYDKSCLDLLEIGVPYSDPLADDKIIAEASFNTAKRGVNLGDVFDILNECRAKFSKPVVLFIYYNLIFAYGEDKFLQMCLKCGVSGLIVPDLPHEECGHFFSKANEQNIALVPLIGATSQYRMDKILTTSSGFIYAIPAIGASGLKSASNDRLKQLVSQIKSKTSLPVAVGFGVQNANEIKSYADGVIIGSPIVELTAKFSSFELMQKINELF